ncbi:sensor histidine kinase [Dyella humicola]|uniref:sensor histidine kinase n=1 Tax=Dyella humicola TaxID=2992126 RepID=UPI00224EA622|nr:HAMP domain-containing sensor histidine kinase [Dyella humicola]
MIVKPADSAHDLSSSLCAICANRLAEQAPDLVLASRDSIQLDALTERSHREARRAIVTSQGDLFGAHEPAQVEAGWQEDARIGVTVKAARTRATDGFTEQEPDEVMACESAQDGISSHLKEHLKILASMSHDLQTPITRMRLRVEALGECAEQQKIVNDLREMEHLVREGVSYARGTFGGAKTRVKIDPAAFLESLVFDYQDMGRPVTLSASIGGQVTTCPKTLRRVLGNLIDNSIKYAGKAEVSAHLKEGDALCVSVSDRGPGIPESELRKVLRPFYRSAGSRHCDIDGAGLGLAIVTQLIRSIEGNLILSNRDGGGLVATITIP